MLLKVPARAAAAAAVARALAGMPPHERLAFSSNSEDLFSIYGSGNLGQKIEELEDEFYEEVSLSYTEQSYLSRSYFLSRRISD